MSWVALLEQWPPFASGALGSLVAGLATGVGALPILLHSRWSRSARVILLATAAGVMLGATFFSLIGPALDIVRERAGNGVEAALVVGAGILIGALAIWGVHAVVPHEHFEKGAEGRAAVGLGRYWLFVLAITLHNVPEGLSVGVAYGGGVDAGLSVTLGIGLQNLPEGLAVAAALMADGSGRARAFWIASATGLAEPLGGLVGAGVLTLSAVLLPWGLAFAAGAMLFVISGEIIPETHADGVERTATISLVAGFVVMMLLDVTFG